MKRHSENMQHINRRTLMPKGDFNKFARQLGHGCSSVNLLHIFRTPCIKNTSGELFLKMLHGSFIQTYKTTINPFTMLLISLTLPEKTRKPLLFFIFSEGIERDQRQEISIQQIHVTYIHSHGYVKLDCVNFHQNHEVR